MEWTQRQKKPGHGSRRRGKHRSDSGASAVAGNPGPELYSSCLFLCYLHFNLCQRAGDYGMATAPDVQGSSITSCERRDTPSTQTKTLLLFTDKDEARLSPKTVIKNNPNLM